MDIDHSLTRSVDILRTAWKRFCLLHNQFDKYVPCGVNIFVGIFLFFLCLPSEGMSQSQLLTGKIVDAETGQSLNAVDIQLGQKSTVSDIDGRFAIRGVSAGDHIIVARALGYEPFEQTISVSPDDTTGLTLQMHRQFAEGDSLFVQNRRYLQFQALSRQKKRGFTSVLSSPRIELFGDYSVKDALQRVPGVQALRDGEINLRGAGLNRHYVMLDGQRMASTGSGTRSVDLGAISADLIREIEVINVLRPDMDADGIGGAVNLVTRQPAGGQRELVIHFGGGANTEYFNRLGVANRFSLTYSEPLLDELTLTVGLSQQQEYDGWESLGIQYETADFGNGPVDVLERVAPGLEADSRGRWGGRLQLTWEPDSQTRYFFRGMINTESRNRTTHNDFWEANGDWFNQDSTGVAGQLGSYGHEASLEDVSIEQYNFMAGGKHLFSSFDLSYQANWSRSNFQVNGYQFPFSLGGLNHSIDMSDRSRPHMQITNFRLQDDGTVDRQFILAESFNRLIDEQGENIFAGRADLTLPVRTGEIKIGTKIQSTSKAGDFRDANLDLDGTIRLIRFNVLREPNRSIDIFDSEYTIPWLLNTEDARAYLESQLPLFTRDENLFHRNSDLSNYESDENLLAGYGMKTFEFGGLSLMAGIRAEYMNASYEGRISEFDENGDFVEFIDETRDESRLDLFPSAILTYQIGDQNMVQAAYSRTISRPDFQQLAPFERIDLQSQSLFRGNPELDPVMSENLDLSFSHYFDEIGFVSAELFYKQIEDFIHIGQRTIDSGDFSGFSERMYVNSDQTADLYGVVLSVDKQLSFLPGFLKDFGFYGNYTWTQSEFEAERGELTDLPRQSPHVLNLSLDYTRGRFLTAVSYHWTDTYLYNLQNMRTLAPSINANEEVYLDSYRDGLSELSVAFRFRISDQFRFWADLSNLIGGERNQFAESRQFYPQDINLYGGQEFRIGITYSL